LGGLILRSFKLLSALLAALAALILGAASASAAVTVKTPPTATFSGASVTVTGGNFSGLGNIPAFAVVTATGVANYDCLNPQGHPSPGQNPVAAQSGSSEPTPLGNSDHNGRGTIPPTTASVTAPPTPTAQQVGCGGTGNTQWTVVLKALTATGAHLEVRQPEGGTLVYCRNFTLGGPATGTAC
jgi:hypothetical protein